MCRCNYGVFYISDCDAVMKRNKAEESLNNNEKDFFGIDTGLHKLYWEFRNSVINKDEVFKVTGYPLLKKAEAFAKKHVDDGVRITNCDDDVHASSSVLYIPHETRNEYWGTSLVIIPQMGNPAIIFLYPRHASKMIEVLSEINNRFVKLA